MLYNAHTYFIYVSCSNLYLDILYICICIIADYLKQIKDLTVEVDKLKISIVNKYFVISLYSYLIYHIVTHSNDPSR